jgi:signal transduction histidine kinase
VLPGSYREGMGVIEGWGRWARARPLLADAVGAVVAFGLSVPASVMDQAGDHYRLRASAVLLAAVSCGALMARRRRPYAVLAVTVSCGALYEVLGFHANPVVMGPVMLTLYTISVGGSRRTAGTVTAVSATVLLASAMAFAPGSWFAPEKLGIVGWTGLAAAAGDAVRSRRAFIAAVEERAERAERAREEESSRRVAEERVRIARELHDVVAHHIALVNAQAGVTIHLMDSRPEQVRAALEQIRDTSSTALDELKATVGLLRQSGDPAAPLEPAPVLAMLPELASSFGHAGLAVEVVCEGQVRPLPAAVGLTAYRIIQEALTNVHKHSGSGTARVALRYHRDLLAITVEDDGRAAPRETYTGRGYGLIGMRERAVAIGGSLNAGALPERGFQVSAELPLRPDSGAPLAKREEVRL